MIFNQTTKVLKVNEIILNIMDNKIYKLSVIIEIIKAIEI